MTRVLAVFLIASAAIPALAASECALESGTARRPVLELYTSEGCNSCPPADRWLGETFPGFATEGAVPLAFHVDYWNRLGWPDRFSRAAFSARQKEAARRQRADVIYTPQFVLDGRDARVGSYAADLRARLAEDRGPAPARLTARVSVAPEGAIRVEGVAIVDEPAARGDALVWVALVQGGLVSDIKAGENAGRRLRHAHVVREFAGPFRPDAAGRAGFAVRWERPVEFRAEDAGVVVFAESDATGRTLQAVAAALCR